MSGKFSLDDYALIPIVRGRNHNRRVVAHVKVDREDYAVLTAHEWRLHQGYALCRSRRCAHSERIFMHRLLLGLGVDDGERYCDHINRDKLDNRRRNLRIVSRAENNQNVPGRGKTSLYRGVSWVSARECWTARVMVGGQLVYSGYYQDEKEAARAAQAVRALYLPYADMVEEAA